MKRSSPPVSIEDAELEYIREQLLALEYADTRNAIARRTLQDRRTALLEVRDGLIRI